MVLLLKIGKEEKAEKNGKLPLKISGSILKNSKIQIDIPTANIWLPKQNLPIKGVYAVECYLYDQIIQGIANMGVRPTIGGSSPVLEIHLFEFDKDIYSERLIVKFIKKIRDEKKFDNLDMLKLQIQEDILIAKNILNHSYDT